MEQDDATVAAKATTTMIADTTDDPDGRQDVRRPRHGHGARCRRAAGAGGGQERASD